MPSFYAMILSSLAGFMVSKLLSEYLGGMTMVVALVVSVFVFYFMKQYLKNLKP